MVIDHFLDMQHITGQARVVAHRILMCGAEVSRKERLGKQAINISTNPNRLFAKISQTVRIDVATIIAEEPSILDTLGSLNTTMQHVAAVAQHCFERTTVPKRVLFLEGIKIPDTYKPILEILSHQWRMESKGNDLTANFPSVSGYSQKILEGVKPMLKGIPRSTLVIEMKTYPILEMIHILEIYDLIFPDNPENKHWKESVLSALNLQEPYQQIITLLSTQWSAYQKPDGNLHVNLPHPPAYPQNVLDKLRELYRPLTRAEIRQVIDENLILKDLPFLLFYDHCVKTAPQGKTAGEMATPINVSPRSGTPQNHVPKGVLSKRRKKKNSAAPAKEGEPDPLNTEQVTAERTKLEALVKRCIASRNVWPLPLMHAVFRAASLIMTSTTSHHAVQNAHGEKYTLPSNPFKDGEMYVTHVWEALEFGDLEGIARWILNNDKQFGSLPRTDLQALRKALDAMGDGKK
ncbi:MAG: hypothetical protein WCX61_00680 [Candidatus Peribacteraceae bacterium]